MKTTWVALFASLLGTAPALSARDAAAQELFPFDVEATPVVEEAIDTPFAVEQTPLAPAAPAPATLEPLAPLVERLPAPQPEPASRPPAVERLPSVADAPDSPELWIYLQERSDRLDPKLAVRAKAALEAEQRQARLAARKWYGTSLARPVVSPTPFMSGYAPGWEPAVRWRRPIEPAPAPPAEPIETPDPERSHDPYGRGR